MSSSPQPPSVDTSPRDPAAVWVRAYRGEDWPEVCAIHDAARAQEVAGVMPPGTFAPMTKAAIDEGFFNGDIFVACHESAHGEVIGFIAIEGSYISWLYVKPSEQGRGVGRALMERVRPFIEPDGGLTVLASNETAVRFYKSCGFMVAAKMPGDCEGYRCDIYRMCLPTSHLRDKPPQPHESSLLLAGFSAENWGHAERDAKGMWHWVR